jgi:galactokinase
MANLENRLQALSEGFKKTFGAPPEIIVSAPGRVNLIGEHTDYNDGYVLPIAINREILIAASPTSTQSVNVYSADFDKSSSFSLDNITHDEVNGWSNYIRGVADTLIKRRCRIQGANMAIQGDVPLGSGLSSSAALEVAAATAFQAINGFEMSGAEMALLCQTAENQFVGVNCGIMDHFISRLGKKDHALFVDCRSLDHELVPMPASGVKVIVSDTRKSRGLVDSEYNLRRAQCEEAVALLGKHIPGIKALRDVTMPDLQRYGGDLPPIARQRAEYVIAENDRVLGSVDALKRGDIVLFGRLMNEAHEGVRDLYEVSCRELDIMVEAAQRIVGVYGSRMTGAGFGGCTVSLVADSAVEEFLEQVPREYHARTGIEPIVYVCSSEDGSQVLTSHSV